MDLSSPSPFSFNQNFSTSMSMTQHQETSENREAAPPSEERVAQQHSQEIALAIQRLTAENAVLRKTIVLSESQKRQTERTHQAKIKILYSEIAQTQQECVGLNQGMMEAFLQSEEQIEAIKRQQTEELRVIALSTKALIATIGQETVSAQAVALTQQKERYLKDLTALDTALEGIHRKIAATIKECESMVSLNIDEPKAITQSDNLVTNLTNYVTAKEKLNQIHHFQALLKPAAQQLKGLIREARETA